MSRTTQDQKQKRDKYFDYKAITFFGVAFQQLNLYISFVTLLVKLRFYLTTPHSITTVGLGFSVFARRYLQNNFYFLFLQLLRCFTSLGERHDNAVYDNATLLALSFLIQRFPDRRLLGASPKLIAA